MKSVNGWYFPDDEKRLLGHMAAMKTTEYQLKHRKESVSYCDQFRTAIDIGAHIGLWARGLTDIFERVICFEPNEERAALLALNAPKVHTIQKVALGSRPGDVAMIENPEDTGASKIDRGAAGTIPMFQLDSYGLSEVDFIKIDVEGYELDVLKGAVETLKNNSPVIILEQKLKNFDPSEEPHAAVKFLIHELGYRVVGKVIDDWIMKKI